MLLTRAQEQKRERRKNTREAFRKAIRDGWEELTFPRFIVTWVFGTIIFHAVPLLLPGLGRNWQYLLIGLGLVRMSEWVRQIVPKSTPSLAI